MITSNIISLHLRRYTVIIRKQYKAELTRKDMIIN